jgi:hypothetical protein
MGIGKLGLQILWKGLVDMHYLKTEDGWWEGQQGLRSTNMRRTPFICPECGAQQDVEHIRVTWFPCQNCSANIQTAYSWKQKVWWVGAIFSVVVLVTLRLTWWISVLAWFPLSIVIAVIVGLVLPDPPIESDKAKDRPKSTLGL